MIRFITLLLIIIFPSVIFADSVQVISSKKFNSAVKKELGLRKVSVQTINFPDRSSDTFTFEMLADEDRVDIQFSRHSNRSSTYKLLIQGEDGALYEGLPGPVETYRGVMNGRPSSFSAASFVDQSFKGFIQLDQNRWWFESINGRVKGASPNTFAVYHSRDVISPEGFCGTIHHSMETVDQEESDSPLERSGGQRSIRYAEILCDSDYEYFQAQGSESNVESQINAIMNAVNALYENQLELSHYITEVVVRPTASDPYSGSISNQLNQLTNLWSSSPTDVVHLFSASSFNNNGTIGLAWLGGVCSTQGAAVVLDCCNSFSCLTDLSAHELGHNWNAPHIDDGNTMNSSLACANNFSSGTVNTITSFSNAIDSCLDENLTCTDEGGSLVYDHCTGALSVTSGSTNFDTTNAQQSCGGFTDVICPNTNFGDMFGDVWFAWEPSLPGEATVSTCGPCPQDCESSNSCAADEIEDCDGSGECHPADWVGDGYCDGTAQQYGANLCCYGGNDGGDCSSAQCSGGGNPVCGNGICEPGEVNGFDTDVVIYRSEIGSCESKTQIACNGDSLACSAGGSKVSFSVNPGNVYYIRVGGTLPSESGLAQLVIEQEVVLEGACCVGESCVIAVEDVCQSDFGGTFNGVGSECQTDTCKLPCPADINGDNFINVIDLLDVVSGFGTSNGDINGDGITNTLDLLDVVSAFGPCK